LLSFDGEDESKNKNLTDADAPIMRTKKGGYDTAYNVQVGCTENQIITYANVVTQGNDKAQLIPVTKGIKSNTGQQIDKMLADADYGCPQGETLTFKKEGKSKDRIYRRYQTDACKNCPVKDLCITAKKARRRVISREVREPLREEMKERLQSEEGKKMYIRRMHPVEAIFGHLKHNLGYTQFLLRGIKKVNAEFVLMCLTQNLRKLMMSLAGFLKKLLLRSILRCQNGKIPDMSINFFKMRNYHNI